MRIENSGLINSWSSDRPYHITNGITLRLNGVAPILEGGPRSLHLGQGTSAKDALTFIEGVLKQRPIAVGPSFKLSRDPTEGPTDVLFALQDGYITSANLAEDMLWRSQKIESCCRWLLAGSNNGPDPFAREACEVILNRVEDGRCDIAGLRNFIDRSSRVGLPIQECFFLHNVAAGFEDVRSALLRASHHLTSMVRLLWLINCREDARNENVERGGEAREIKHSSPTADHVAEEFTSGVIATYSALDVLVRFFVLLIREPFGSPAFPENLHFTHIEKRSFWSDVQRHKPGDLTVASVPSAIPLLVGGEHDPLRKLRNELVHNMAPDDVRPKIYIGVGTPRVFGRALQYAEYRTRDIDSDGNPISHPWCRRFYNQDRSADSELHQWLASVWGTVNDTCDWIVQRLRVIGTERGVPIP